MRTPISIPGRPSLRGGFSLVELMMVVVLLGLLASAVAWSWDAMVPMAKLNSSVRSLAATLQGTRSEAISQKAEYWIEYDLDDNAYTVISPFHIEGGLLRQGDYEDDRLSLEKVRLPLGVKISAVYLNGDEFTEGKVRARFDPLGAASDHAIIIVQPQYENFYTIEVLALTGLIRFHQGIFSRQAPDDSDFQ